MCGISGLINWKGTTQKEIKLVEKSLSAMLYRGPDFSNVTSDAYSVLGHNRLSIIDLDSRSNQPMISKCERYSIVFNGEIYNFKELKLQLENEGVTFSTTSDTEVLLEGFIKYGDSIVNLIRGMFAFVIWDNQINQLFAARDRFGEKPFYYFNNKGKGVGFASNLSGIVKLKKEELTINKQALYELLSLQYIDNSTCIYNGIEKLSPGSFMKISNNTCEIKTYWSPNYKNKIDASFNESKKHLHNLLKNSVKEQLVADVPLGLFLSGGVDSSIIAAIASKEKSDITAITMSVPEHSAVDEAEAASYVAKKLNINHRIVNLDNKSVNNLPYILKTIEPLADASLIPSMTIANAAKNDFKVMLSGDGGDEMFGGYSKPENFNNNKYAGNYFTKHIINRVIINSSTFPYNYLYSKLNDARIFKYGGLKEYYNNKSISINQAKLILNDSYDFKNTLTDHYQESEKYTNLEVDKLLYVGVKSNLPNDFLFKMDSANMFCSVESRAPFLDHRIIDYTQQLKINQLMPNGIDKEILKSIGALYLPKEFFNLPKKGFFIPYYEYLKNSWGNLIEKFMDEGISSDMDLFDKTSILNLLAEYKKKPTFKVGKILYSILVFEIWLRVFHLKRNPDEIKLL